MKLSETVKGFDRARLYIEYVLKLPDGWSSSLKSTELVGMCQTCLTDDNYMAVVNLPFQFDLETVSDVGEWPVLFVRVTSISLFGRHVHEGFGYQLLPQFPGRSTITINTFRRVPSNPIDMLSDYFLNYWKEDDGSEDEEDGIPGYPETTVSGGTIEISINTLLKTNSLRNEVKKRRTIVPTQTSIEEVIQSFERAKARMIELRERMKLLMNYEE